MRMYVRESDYFDIDCVFKNINLVYIKYVLIKNLNKSYFI